MSFTKFIINHINDIINYVQPAIHWREGRFSNPVGKAKSTNGDFAEVVRSLPVELSREDVVGYFREDLYKGFVATIMWGGISRFRAEGIARNNDRNTTMPKLERLVEMLRDAETDIERIENAIASLRRGGENYLYGIGPSYFTKLLYFLSYDMDLNIRPLIYDENMKPVHFVLMPDVGQNPFYYYLPVGNKVIYAEDTKFEDVYYDYCELMCKTARKIGVDVKDLEAWAFGWPANINTQQPNPRVVAKTEVERMASTGILRYNCGIEELDDAIGASRIFYDNGINVLELFDKKDGILNNGNDEVRPIVINETDNYVHLEYVITDILFHLMNLEAKLISQHLISVGDKNLDRLCFEVKPAQDKKPKEMDVYFDITAGYLAAGESVS
jgi:hypothetical protein